MRSRPSCLSVSFFALAVSISGAPSALAQTADGDDGAATRGGDIIVTAERRVSTVQDTPIALTAITGEELTKQAKVTIEEVLLDSPSTLVQSAAQGGRVYIRGVGGDGDSNFVDSAVSIMVDNVYSGRSEVVYVGTYDVNRFEVLRGPQGTLYGRNATGGNVNVITNNPEFDDIHMDVNLRTGNYNLVHGDAAVNLPISDSVAVRIAGLREKRDGYFKSYDGTTLGGESDIAAVRGKLRVQTGPVDLILAAEYIKTKAWTNITVALPGTPTQLDSRASDTPLIADPVCATMFASRAPCYFAGDDPYTTDGSHPGAYRDLDLFTAYAQLDWDLGFATLTFIPSYSDNSRLNLSSLVTGTVGRDLTAATYDETQNSQELRLASNPGSRLEWVVGAYRLYTDNHNVTPASATNPATTTALAQEIYSPGIVESKALFGDFTYSVTDQLRITIGGRYTWDKKESVAELYGFPVDGTFATDGPTYSAGDAFPTPNFGPTAFPDKYSAFTWKVGLEYDVTPDNLLYATVSKGYKAGGYSTQTLPPISYDPETLIAYEVGSKNKFLNNALTVNLAAFYYDYSNLQFQLNTRDSGVEQPLFIETLLTADPYNLTDAQYQEYVDAYAATYGNNASDARNSIYVFNAVKSRNYGAEADIRWLVTPSDEFSVSYGYLNHKYGDVEFSGLEAISGQIAANSPKHTLRLGYQHWFDLGESGELNVRVGTRYSSEYFTTTSPLRTRLGYYQAGYWKSDASITWEDADGMITVTGWIKNIENEAVITGGFFRPPFPGYNAGAAIFADPRTYGVTVGLHL